MQWCFLADSGVLKLVLFLGVAARVLIWTHFLVPSSVACSYFSQGPLVERVNFHAFFLGTGRLHILAFETSDVCTVAL